MRKQFSDLIHNVIYYIVILLCAGFGFYCWLLVLEFFTKHYKP